MRRRDYLTTAGMMGTFALAGCTDDTEDVEGGTRDGDDNDSDGGDGGGGDGNESDGDGGDGNESTDGEDSSDDGGSSGSASVEITDHELVVDEGEFATDVYVAATVENTGDARSGNIELQADWYDADGNYLDNDLGWLITLRPGETWEARIYALASSPEEIDDYELEGEFAEPGTSPPDGLELLTSEMQAGEDDVTVTGEVENGTGEDQSYVAAVATIYDEEGVVLGDDWTNVTDLRDGETWAFEIMWLGRDRTDRAADHEPMLSTTV